MRVASLRKSQWMTLTVFLALQATPGCSLTRVALGPDDAALPPMTDAGAGPPKANDLPPPRAAKVCLGAAQYMEKQGLEADAIRQYERARELDPSLPGISRRLAVLYDKVGDFDRAGTEYKLALEKAPRDADLLNDAGYFAYERGDWGEAERLLRQALQESPTHSRAWVNLGMTLAQQEKIEASLEAFGRVVSPAEGRSNVAMILAQRGRFEEARAQVEAALRLEPGLTVSRALIEKLDGGQTAANQAPRPPRLSAN